MNQLQSRADRVRNLVEEHEAIRRVGLEVLWAQGTAADLVLRARHHDRVITLERGPDWPRSEPQNLALELARELVTEALGTDRPHVPLPLWRRHAAPAAES